MSEVEFIEWFLPLLCSDSKPLFVGIVEEQYRPQDSRLSHSLRTNEVYVAVELYFGIADVRTVYEHYLIQVSHRSPPR